MKRPNGFGPLGTQASHPACNKVCRFICGGLGVCMCACLPWAHCGCVYFWISGKSEGWVCWWPGSADMLFTFTGIYYSNSCVKNGRWPFNGTDYWCFFYLVQHFKSEEEVIVLILMCEVCLFIWWWLVTSHILFSWQQMTIGYGLPLDLRKQLSYSSLKVITGTQDSESIQLNLKYKLV